MRNPVRGPRIIPFGEDYLSSDVLPNGHPAFRVTQRFGDTDLYWMQQGIYRPHGALDLGNHNCGDEVVAAHDGVAYPMQDAAGAMGVQIRSGGDIDTEYWHLAKDFIDAGQPVTRGTAIGRVGSTGLNIGGCHLHFVVTEKGKAVDPWPLLDQNQERRARINGDGINVRGFPGNQDKYGYLYATTAAGRLIRKDGFDLGSSRWAWKFGGFVKGHVHGIGNHPDQWGRLYIRGGWRYVARGLLSVVR